MPPLPAKTAIGQPFIELNTVESTNIYAMEQLQANLAAHGFAFFAHDQTAGKGQRGKQWVSEPGTHIALSVILDCSFLSAAQQFPLSVMAALATHDLFSKYAGDETCVKWPNDLYWRDRKAGGILIETLVRGNIWQWSVVGIGININQVSFPGSMPNPVSLKQITGKDFPAVVLAKELCSYLENYYRQLKEGRFPQMLSYYNEILFKRGQDVTLKKESAVFRAKIEGVNEAGELLLSGGIQDSYRFGELEWVLNR